MFHDRAHILFVNGSYKRDSCEEGELYDIEKLMIDFNRSDTSNFYHKILGDRVALIKNSREDVDFILEYITEHADEFREEGKIISVFNFILSGMKRKKSLKALQEILEIDDDKFNDFLLVIEDNPKASAEELCEIYFSEEN